MIHQGRFFVKLRIFTIGLATQGAYAGYGGYAGYGPPQQPVPVPQQQPAYGGYGQYPPQVLSLSLQSVLRIYLRGESAFLHGTDGVTVTDIRAVC